MMARTSGDALADGALPGEAITPGEARAVFTAPDEVAAAAPAPWRRAARRLLADGEHTPVGELLHALGVVDLGRIEVAL